MLGQHLLKGRKRGTSLPPFSSLCRVRQSLYWPFTTETDFCHRLVLSHLPKHPEARTPEGKAALKKANLSLETALKKLEDLKPRLDARYDAYIRKTRSARSSSISSNLSSHSTTADRYVAYNPDASRTRHSQHRDSGSHWHSGSSSSRSYSPYSQSTQTLDSTAYALEMARHEYEKREKARREQQLKKAQESGTNIVTDSMGHEVKRVSAPSEQSIAYMDGWNSMAGSLASTYQKPQYEPARERFRSRQDDPDDLSQRIQALSMMQQQSLGYDGYPGLIRDSRPPSRPTNQVGSWTGSYPSVPKRTYDIDSILIPSPPPPQYQSIPKPPPKQPLQPSLPRKIPISTPSPDLPLPQSLRSGAPPIPDKIPAEESKPAITKNFYQPSDQILESGTSLRTVFLPQTLISTFLGIAHSHSQRNLEFCAILAGELLQNAFFISRLIIPPQVSTSDTCAMTDENLLFSYCSQEDLMVLGWIHTHPSQSCFMSSVDCHTHWGFQWQLGESIAVVCAVKEREWGVFRLTDPPGQQVVGKCTKQGFHEHDTGGRGDVYRECRRDNGRGGHVVLVEHMAVEIVDLRKG